jgi:serine protease AprX
VAALQRDPAVRTLALDAPIAPAMALADKTVAADLTRAGAAGGLLTKGIPGVSGRGVGVAIVDSGIAAHDALAGKVVAATSFIPGDASVVDAFGHGTHIAGIIAGSATPAQSVTAEYRGGIAPGAHLINARVLDEHGQGYTSSVVAAVDWLIANRARYGIRVVNLSLGTTITAPCPLDPMCASVQRLVQAGMIPVVSAGNRGRSSNGRTVLGSITSPGNSPFAITVGALNMWSSAARFDDTVTTYSSRGPTAFEFLPKPDVVAPGNKIVSLEARNGYLATTFPESYVAGRGSNAYRRMSGTSMSAAVVSGGIALLV